MLLPTPIQLRGCWLFFLAALTATAQVPATDVYATRARTAFALAQKEFTDHPDDARAASQLGRTSFDLADLTTNTDDRAAVARAGIGACQHLLARDPASTPGHYYLGMDYGELASAEAPSMAAYRLIRQIEAEFKSAKELDERYDYAGPDRCLGLLYRDAPGWPISIGNRRKARESLERAAELAPDYPGNQMNLLESYIRWHQAPEAEMAWQKLSAIWNQAETNLTGVAWEASWTEWRARRANAGDDFEKAFKRPPAP